MTITYQTINEEIEQHGVANALALIDPHRIGDAELSRIWRDADEAVAAVEHYIAEKVAAIEGED